jgi:hypothetical protein
MFKLILELTNQIRITIWINHPLTKHRYRIGWVDLAASLG